MNKIIIPLGVGIVGYLIYQSQMAAKTKELNQYDNPTYGAANGKPAPKAVKVVTAAGDIINVGLDVAKLFIDNKKKKAEKKQAAAVKAAAPFAPQILTKTTDNQTAPELPTELSGWV